jgi:hypothetical protein
MITEERITIEQIDHHRNGVGGDSFYVVLFKYQPDSYDPNDPRDPEPMMAVLFDLDQDEEGKDAHDRGEFYNTPCAVFNRNKLERDEIRFGHNSWRGDEFDDILRTACKEWSKAEFAKLLGQSVIAQQNAEDR